MQLKIYHTNDVHSNFSFLRRVYAYLNAHRWEQDLYVDSGDFCDLKSILVQSDHGRAAVELMRMCSLDAMALGNNEIDLGSEAVEALSDFPLLSVNAAHNDGTALQGLKNGLLLERGGKRFLIVGLSPFFNVRMEPGAYNLFFEMGNIRTSDPVPAVRAVLEANRGKFDFVIALSHCGHLVDRELAKQLPEIDLWLEGHSHAVITEPQFSQSGKGEFLGCVTLEIQKETIRILNSEQIDLPDISAPTFDAALRMAEEKADRILSRELPTAGELTFDPFRESELTNFICDCLRHRFGGDFAIVHSGISEGPLCRPVSRKSLIENFPSKLNPTIYTIGGSRILEAVQLSLDEDHIRQSGQGAGFRGRVLGCLGFSANVRVTREPFGMWVDGEPVDPTRQYTIVTDDYLQRGTGYPSLRVPDDEAKFDKWFIRDLVQHYLTDEALFASAKTERGKKYGI